MRITRRHLAIFATLAVAPGLIAMDDADLRIAPQVLVSNAGFEPGIALELRTSGSRTYLLRPELLITDEGDDLGGGLSFLLDVADPTDLPGPSHILVGPRVIHHNDDDYGWDGGALAMWVLGIGSNPDTTPHHVEIIGVVGLVEDRDEDDVDPSLTLGGAYAFRF